MRDMTPFLLRRMLALRQFPMLADAELGELAMLAENLIEATFAPGQIVAPAGVRPSALHLVVSGELASPSEGRTWGPRHAFGTLEVLARRALTGPVIATRPTQTLQLLSSEITEVLDENFGVLRAAVQGLSARMIALVRLPQISVPEVTPLGLVDRLIVLRQQAPFAHARLDALAMLAHASEELSFPAGAVVARRGELATATLVVVEGALHARRNDSDAATLGPGQAIAPFETLAELPHPATLEATTAVRALASTATAIYDTIEDHTDLGLAMIRAFATTLLDAREIPAATTAQHLPS